MTSASSTDTLASAALAPASASRRSSRFRPLLEPSGSFHQPFPLRLKSSGSPQPPDPKGTTSARPSAVPIPSADSSPPASCRSDTSVAAASNAIPPTGGIAGAGCAPSRGRTARILTRPTLAPLPPLPGIPIGRARRAGSPREVRRLSRCLNPVRPAHVLLHVEGHEHLAGQKARPGTPPVINQHVPADVHLSPLPEILRGLRLLVHALRFGGFRAARAHGRVAVAVNLAPD